MANLWDRRNAAFRLFADRAMKVASFRSEPINSDELQSIAELSSDVRMQIASRQLIAFDECTQEITRLLYNVWSVAGKRTDRTAPSSDQLDAAFDEFVGPNGLDNAISGFCRSQGYVPVEETMAAVDAIRATPQTDDI